MGQAYTGPGTPLAASRASNRRQTPSFHRSHYNISGLWMSIRRWRSRSQRRRKSSSYRGHAFGVQRPRTRSGSLAVSVNGGPDGAPDLTVFFFDAGWRSILSALREVLEGPQGGSRRSFDGAHADNPIGAGSLRRSCGTREPGFAGSPHGTKMSRTIYLSHQVASSPRSRERGGR